MCLWRIRYGTITASLKYSAKGCLTNCPTSCAKSLRYWRPKWPKPGGERLVGGDLHETERHRLGPGDCARSRWLCGRQRSCRQSDVEVREAIGDKFPKHIYHSIVCIGALCAPLTKRNPLW